VRSDGAYESSVAPRSSLVIPTAPKSLVHPFLSLLGAGELRPFLFVWRLLIPSLGSQELY
jgi:hypothetical protein